MPFPRDLLPHLPTEGPPLPRGLGIGWPATPEDVEKAVREYAESAEKAIYHYQADIFRRIEKYRFSWHYAVEGYRKALMARLPPPPRLPGV